MKVADPKKHFRSPRLVLSGLAQVKSISKAVISAEISLATISQLSRLRFLNSRCWQLYHVGRNWGLNNGSWKRRNGLRVLIAGHSYTAMQPSVTAVKNRSVDFKVWVIWNKIHVLDVFVGGMNEYDREIHHIWQPVGRQS